MSALGHNHPPSDIDPYEEMTLAELHRRQRDLEDTIARYKGELQRIAAVVHERLAVDARGAFDDADKDHGQVTLALPDQGLKARAEIKRTVAYDQDALQRVSGDMTWAEIQHYLRVKLDVPEKVYAALPPGDPFADRIKAARTTKLSDMRITLEEVGS